MRRVTWILMVGLLVAADGAAGQSGEGLAVQASVRSRAELWDWFGSDDGGRYGYLGTLVRVGVGQQASSFGWQLEAAAPVLLGLPEDAGAALPRGQLGLGASYYAANDGESSAAGLFLKQANVRLGARPGGAGHGVRFGRFEFAEGTEVAPTDPTLAALKRDRIAHRLLGNFGWSHVGRSLDGVQYGYTSPGWNATALVARPTRGVFDVDGWSGLDSGVGYLAATLRDREGSPFEGRIFFLQYLDDRPEDGVAAVDNRPLPTRQADAGAIRVSTLGSHLLAAVGTPAGTADLLLWGAVQRGDWGMQDHRAWAAGVEAGLQPPVLPALRPWIRAGHFRSSGDPRSTDDVHETFFQVLPTPRIYARMPFYNLMNLEDTFLSVAVRPAPAVTLRTDARVLRLGSGADLWYAGGGAFEDDSFGFAGRPAGGSRDLATLFDLSAEYRASARLTATLYAALARGGDVIDAIYPDGATARLGYLEVEYRY